MTHAVEAQQLDEVAEMKKVPAHICCKICYPDPLSNSVPFSQKGICGATLVGIDAPDECPTCEACLAEREEHFLDHWILGWRGDDDN